MALNEDDSDQEGEESGPIDGMDDDSDEDSDDDEYRGPRELPGSCDSSPVTSSHLTRCGCRTHLFTGDQEEEFVVCAAHQRRLALAAAALLLSKSGQGPTGPNRKPIEFSWTDHVARMTEAEFKLRYRLSTTAFDELLGLLEPRLRVSNEKQAINSRGGCPICLEARLAVALRYFAGGDVRDLVLIYNISRAWVFDLVWQVVDAINLSLDNMKFDRQLTDADALRKLELDFRARTRGDFWRGQVGAIDGVHFKMQRPSATDVPDPARYHVSRKDIYAMLAIAICDVERRFIWADCSMAPQTHDSTAWSGTELGQRVADGELPAPYFLNGDAAFALSNSMITPSNNDPALDDYDFYQSSNRMAIECAFGILIRRWGVLWRPLTQRFDRRAPLIFALMRLHNFCIDARLAEDELPDVLHNYPEFQPGRCAVPPKFDKDMRPIEALDTCIYTDVGAPTRKERTQVGSKTARRDELNAAIKAGGFKRILNPRGNVRIAKNPKGKRPKAKRQ